MCAICQRQMVGTGAARESKTPPRSTIELIRYEFGSRDLVLVPDLERGWRPHQKVSCFVEDIVVDTLAERRLRIRVAIFPRASSGYSRDWLHAPAFADRSSETHRRRAGRQPRNWNPVSWSASVSGIAIQVPIVGPDAGFNPALSWRQRPSEKLELHLVEYDIPPHRSLLVQHIEDDDRAVHDLLFELQLIIVAEPRPLKRPIQCDWYRRFCPGGLPSLGKRA